MDDFSRDGDNRQGVAASPLDDLRGALLPGMEAEVLPAPVDDDIIDRLPEHSAERLLALHPDRYALATALFFGCPTISFRQVCRIARVGTHTLQHIIRREEHGRTASEWAKSAGARLRVLADMTMAVASDQLSDAEAVSAAGIKGVATILREATHAHALIEGRLPGQQPKQSAGSPDDYLAAVREAQLQSIEADILEPARGADEAVVGGADEDVGGLQDD